MCPGIGLEHLHCTVFCGAGATIQCALRNRRSCLGVAHYQGVLLCFGLLWIGGSVSGWGTHSVVRNRSAAVKIEASLAAADDLRAQELLISYLRFHR